VIVHVAWSVKERFAQSFAHGVSEQVRLEAILVLVGELLVVEIPYEQPGTDIQAISEKLGVA
jgi:hypothetical protein